MRRVSLVAAVTALAALVLVVLAAAFGPASGGAPVEVATRSGFGPVDVRDDGRTRWLETDTGRLVVTVRDRPRAVTLAVELSAFAQARRVTLTRDGRTVAEDTVPTGRFVTLTADLGTLAPGRHEIGVAAVPGPQSIAETIGVPDPRRVSVRARAITVREGAP